MPNLPSIAEMLKAGMHFGHRTSRWHPKMRPFIYGARGGVHIINLEETSKELQLALNDIKEIVSRGGTVLFVGTKAQAKDIIKKSADESAMPYVTERWLGGTLTNYKQLKESLKRFKKLKDQRDKGELRKYTKKEQLLIEREIADLNRKLGGIENMTKVPEAIFVVDVRKEKTAIREANMLGAKVIAICDTNSNPAGVDRIIPANDDAVKTIELISNLVVDAIKEGKAAGAKVATDNKQKEIQK